MLAELAETWGFLGAKVDRTSWRVTFPGGSWLQWVSAEQALSIKGLRCDAVYVDECDQIDSSLIDARVMPWMTELHSLRVAVFAGTPEKGRYGLLYRTFARANGLVKDENGNPFEGHSFSHATSWQFPHFASEPFLRKRQAETPKAIFVRESLCHWDAAEGLVYPMFDVRFHVRRADASITWTEIIVGVDYGTTDAGVIVVLGVQGHGRDATLYLLEETYETERDTTWWMERVAAVAWKYQAFRQHWYHDPSRPDRILDFRRAVRTAYPQLLQRFSIEGGNNEREAGVDAVADRLMIRRTESDEGERYARLYVSPDCPKTIAEFSKYRRKRDPRNHERVLEDIQDGNDHAMDSLRYAVFTRFGGPDRQRYEIGG